MLQLEKYFYPNVLVKSNPEFKQEKKEFEGKLEVKTKLTPLSNEKRRWEVSLRIKSAQVNGHGPYQFELETVGIFTVSPDFPEGEMKELVRVAGCSMLYSASREFLLIVTSRGPFGVINLPSITFQKSPKELRKKKTPKCVDSKGRN